jgi:hypothetical protein
VRISLVRSPTTVWRLSSFSLSSARGKRRSRCWGRGQSADARLELFDEDPPGPRKHRRAAWPSSQA